MNKLQEMVTTLKNELPIIWDRYVKSDDEQWFGVYGWIARSDGHRDFVLLQYWVDGETFHFVTSSAKYSKQICKIVDGTDEGHGDCIKIEELFK